MSDLVEQAESFYKKHPVLGLIFGGAAAVVAKKEYDRRYHSRLPKEEKEKDDE